jgi:hypothetical protein
MRFFPWSSGYTFADSDAAAYVAAVEAADTQPLETGVKSAIDALFVGLKADGEWNAFGVLHCLAGPRTLDGLAVPMKGVAPTLVNFVSGDINRKTGLLGNLTTKYINHDRNNNSDGQNDQQVWSYLTSLPSTGAFRAIFGTGAANAGATNMFEDATTARTAAFRSRNGTADSVAAGIAVGLIGVSRDNSANFQFRGAQTNSTITRVSQAPSSGSMFSFARNNGGTAGFYSDQRSSFVGIGAAWTNPANIEARIDTYMAAIAAAIP